MSSIGINKRFIDENLVLGKSINPSGFGSGTSGREKAAEAALKNPGSEIIFKDDKNIWQAKEIDQEDINIKVINPLSHVDKQKIELNEKYLVDNKMKEAFISFEDDKPAPNLPENVASLTSGQKLSIGNKVVLNNFLEGAKDFVYHPFSSTADLGVGIVTSTINTLKHPVKTVNQIKETYQKDKVEGIIQGVKATGAIVASAALIVGLTSAIAGWASTGTSLQLGKAISVAGSTEEVARLIGIANTVTQVGKIVGTVGVTAGVIGNASGIAILGATGVSLIKNQYDLANVKDKDKMQNEISQITNDAQVLTTSVVIYAANYGLKKASAKVKDLYTESKSYKPVTPESRLFMDEMIKDKSKFLAENIKIKVPEYQPEVWKTLSDTQKLDLLNKVNQIIGEAYNFEPAPIKFYEGVETSCGFYEPATNVLNINSIKLNDFYGIANTLTHEQFHGFQNHLMTQLGKDGTAPENLNFQEHLINWVDNDYTTGYASTSSNPEFSGVNKFAVGQVFPKYDTYKEYRLQPVEESAWHMGNVFEQQLKKSIGKTQIIKE